MVDAIEAVLRETARREIDPATDIDYLLVDVRAAIESILPPKPETMPSDPSSLVITGLPTDDIIHVDQNGSIRINDELHTFDPATVDEILIHSGGGNDRLKVDVQYSGSTVELAPLTASITHSRGPDFQLSIVADEMDRIDVFAHVTGTLAGMVAFLLWIYVSVAIVLVGAELAAVLNGNRPDP